MKLTDLLSDHIERIPPENLKPQHIPAFLIAWPAARAGLESLQHISKNVLLKILLDIVKNAGDRFYEYWRRE